MDLMDFAKFQSAPEKLNLLLYVHAWCSLRDSKGTPQNGSLAKATLDPQHQMYYITGMRRIRKGLVYMSCLTCSSGMFVVANVKNYASNCIGCSQFLAVGKALVYTRDFSLLA